MARNSRKSGANLKPNQTMLRRTLFLMVACGIVAFFVLAGRLFYLQVIKHEYYESLAIEQQVRQTTVSASRGTIYDANGKILAMSASVETIYVSPVEIIKNNEDPNLIARELSRILDVDEGEILEKIGKEKSWYQTIAKKVEQDVADEVREFKNEHKIIGVRIEADTKRYYPYSSLAAHVVGFVGADNDGLGGIEAQYESYLKGVDGRIVRAKNSAGTDMLFTKFEDYYDAENGHDLSLTIDSTIQYHLEKHLENAVEDYQVQNGAAAIAMNVKTGGILGMASLGNFDLNNYQLVAPEIQEIIDGTANEEEKTKLQSDALNLQWRNKAVSDTYEPGSTFKIITLAMALEEGLTHADEGFNCGGSMEVRGRTEPVNCWKRQGHGPLSLTQSVQQSCNMTFIKLGQRVGPEKFDQYIRDFGFRNKTNIDLAGESDSIWWDSNLSEFLTNHPDSLASASFGQTFTITPLQLITAVSACANGGYLMQPYIVDEIRDSDGNIVQKHEPTVVRQVISEETSALVREMLEQVVGDPTLGTGKNAYVPGYRIAGKTGTSEKVAQLAKQGENERKEYIVSFIGFAPANDPEIAILVLLDDPPKTQPVYVSGGQMGAPTVGKMFADILPYMGIEPQYTEAEQEHMDKTVPMIRGRELNEAIATLEQEGLSYRIIGEGTEVTGQLPNANTIVAADSQVILYAGGEPSEGMETMPDLTGYNYSTARQILGDRALFIKSTGAVSNGSSVLITSQSIEPGTQIKHGTIVEVSMQDNSNLGYY